MIYDTYSNLIYLAIDTFSHIRSCPSIIARDLDHFVLRTKKEFSKCCNSNKVAIKNIRELTNSNRELSARIKWET